MTAEKGTPESKLQSAEKLRHGSQRQPAAEDSPAEACRFCAIIRGELPAHMVYEDSDTLAFLDRRPLFPGHLLLLPRAHHVTLGELPFRLVAPLFEAAQLLARAVELGLEAQGSFIAMNNRVSQSVPHLHIHIVPRRRHDGLKGFFWPRYSYRDDLEMARTAQLIRAALETLKQHGR